MYSFSERITTMLKTTFALAVTVAISAGAASAGTRFDEDTMTKYTLLAGRVVSMAAACRDAKVFVETRATDDQIHAAFVRFGASEEEITEWKSRIVAEKAPDIKKVLETEDPTTDTFYCTQSIAVQSLKMEKMLGNETLTADKVLEPNGPRGSILSRWRNK